MIFYIQPCIQNLLLFSNSDVGIWFIAISGNGNCYFLQFILCEFLFKGEPPGRVDNHQHKCRNKWKHTMILPCNYIFACAFGLGAPNDIQRYRGGGYRGVSLGYCVIFQNGSIHGKVGFGWRSQSQLIAAQFQCMSMSLLVCLWSHPSVTLNMDFQSAWRTGRCK